jgi:hypothetical protein
VSWVFVTKNLISFFSEWSTMAPNRSSIVISVRPSTAGPLTSGCTCRRCTKTSTFRLIATSAENPSKISTASRWKHYQWISSFYPRGDSK